MGLSMAMGSKRRSDVPAFPAARVISEVGSFDDRREFSPEITERGKRPQEQVENDQPISEQARRAREIGRGRRAKAPWRIPWKGWKDIFWRVYASIGDNHLLAVAGGVAFYSLLAIFPAVAAFVSLYSLIADASTIDTHPSARLRRPAERPRPFLIQQLTKLEAKSNTKLGLGFLFGLGVALVERQRRDEGDHRRAERRV